MKKFSCVTVQFFKQNQLDKDLMNIEEDLNATVIATCIYCKQLYILTIYCTCRMSIIFLGGLKILDRLMLQFCGSREIKHA